MARYWPLPGLLAALGAALLAACAPSAPEGPVVLAASSMTEALEASADAWAAQGHARPVLSFASSAAVARQLEQGAPGDLVVTADAEWMDWLAERDLLRAGTRRDLAGNSLVLVAPGDPQSMQALRYADPAEPLRTLTGRLAIAEPAAVPAGRYAMAALASLGLDRQLADRLVPAENVRAALALVERGEVDAGIVYASDALASGKVVVLARFDPSSHPPIRYPVAVVARSQHADSEAFASFLASGDGQAILRAHGFEALP